MSYLQQFLWVIFPYLTLAAFLIGHIYRYNTDQFGWKTKSSEFLEKKSLRLGSILFHIGILMVFGGHVIGLIIPKAFMVRFGITEDMYHFGAVFIGGVAGIITFIGIIILLFRRLGDKRIRRTGSFSDVLIAILLFTEIGLGLYNTLGHNLIFGGFDYRTTISPWFRGLLTFTPDASLMVNIPIIFKLHTLMAFGIFGLWPFTRLVHVWSLPLEYLNRSFIIYRKRRINKSY